MKILGLIPARGGSKGIPNKNRKELSGKPLLQHTIEAAQNAEQLDHVIFSSDDQSLIDLAEGLGVDVPFVRPAHLAEDTSGTLEVVQHALNFLAEKRQFYHAVCLLQVTNPFRTSSFIDKAILHFKKSEDDSLISVLKVPHEYNPHWVFEKTVDGNLKIATGEQEIIKRRQDLSDAFIRDGSIYITRTEILLKRNSLYGQKIGYIETDVKTYVNIDTMDDWKRAEKIAEKFKM